LGQKICGPFIQEKKPNKKEWWVNTYDKDMSEKAQEDTIRK
jgi:hypothetical protein